MSIHADRIIAVRTSKIVYRDGDTAVKVFDSDYSPADVLNEALNQARVEETELKIPRIQAVLMLEGKWTIVSEYVEGQKLQQLMIEHPEKSDEYMNLFVDLHCSIHQQRCPLLTNLRDKMNRKIESSMLEKGARDALLASLAALPEQGKLCHGDFIPSNVMIAEDGTPFILDWSHATQGSAAADAARTYLLFLLQGRDDAAEKYLELFCHKSAVAKEDVRRWLRVVAASHLINVRPAERDFMLRFVQAAQAQ